MSSENVELAKAIIPQDTDFIPLFRDEDRWARMRVASGALFTDDFESVVVFPDQTRTKAGLDGLRKNWVDWLEPWATYRTHWDEVIDLGDRVLFLLRDYGRRKDMDTEVELISATMLTFREGKVARWEDFAHRADAFEAAGLAEDVHSSS